MEVRGQAVIVDALFFMLICGSAAALLFWASSVYGEKSYNAYKYMYLNDYETSIMSAISKVSYNIEEVDIGTGVPSTVTKYWLDELGTYLKGEEFDETYPRYARMVDEWVKFCAQAPVPIVLEVYNEKPTPRGNMEDHLFFACPKSPKGKDPKVYHGSSVYSVQPIADKAGVHGTDGTILDPIYDYMFHKQPKICDDAGCGTPQGQAAGDYSCSTSIPPCDPLNTEPPYFSSNVQRKLCADLVCVMQTKVYY